MLKIENLQKTYGNYHALDGLNMEIPKGALYGFVGPNGAGKTTTIKIITGLLKPDSGSVVIDGVDALYFPRKLKSMIGYVPDHFGVYDNLKVSEYMEFFASCYGMEGLKSRKRCHALLEQVGLEDKMDFFVDGLSRGMKQRLCLARSLIHDPSVLIMDEPTAGLDPRTRLEFRSIVMELHEMGKTVLLSSHLLEDLSELCTHIGIIDSGKMTISGSLSEIIEQVQTSKPISIKIHENIDLAMRVLKEHPLVRTITIKDREIMVGFTGGEEEERKLLQEMILAGVPVSGFMREPGSLETIFMQITNRDKERVVLSYEDESGL